MYTQKAGQYKTASGKKEDINKIFISQKEPNIELTYKIQSYSFAYFFSQTYSF